MTPDVLKTMLATLDVNSDYVDALKQKFNSGETANALVDAIDSRLQHSAYSARLDGDLSAADYELIQSVRNVSGSEDPPSSSQLGGLKMTVDDRSQVSDQFKDILVFHDSKPGNKRFVMYAPGAPDKEFYSANSEDGLSRVVYNWTKTEAGRRYLVNQLDPANREKALAFLEKGLGWKLSAEGDGTPTVGWKEFSGVPYLSRLGDAAAERGRAQVAEAEAAIRPTWYAGASAAERKQFDMLNAASTAATEAYQKEVDPESFREYAHKQVQDSVNASLRTRGVDLQVDPDTVEVEVNGSWRTLTDVVTYGYRDTTRFNFVDFAKFRSTVGQDVSALNEPKTAKGHAIRQDIDSLARGSYIGDKYVQMTTEKHLSNRLSQRQDLHQTATAAMMRRDALEAKFNNQLTAEQYQAVSALIDQWHTRDTASSRDIAAGKAPGFYQFKLNDKEVRGVYALRVSRPTSSTLDELIYTPGAPDGKVFRSRDDIKQSLAKDAAHPYQSTVDYFTDRMLHTDRNAPAIRDLAWNIKNKDDAGIRTDTSTRISGKTNLEYDRSVQRLIDDVKATTKSRGEVVGELAWNTINYAVTAVTLPFGLAAGLPALARLVQLPKLALRLASGFKAFPWHLPFQTFSAVTGGGLAAKGFTDGVAAAQDGDRAAAFGNFASGILDLAGAAGDILDVAKGLKYLNGRVKRLPSTALSSKPAATAPTARPGKTELLETSDRDTLVVNSKLRVDLPPGNAVTRTDGYLAGVTEIAGPNGSTRYFVPDGNRYLEVVRDDDYLTLRVVDPRKRGQQAYYTPIKQNEHMQWVFNRDVGGRAGGKGDDFQGMNSRLAELPNKRIANLAEFERLKPDLVNYLSTPANKKTLDRLIDLAAAKGKITLDDRAAALAKTNQYERASEFLSTFTSRCHPDDRSNFPDLLKIASNEDAAGSALATIQSRVAQERRALEEWPARITSEGYLEGKALEQQQQALSEVLASYSNSAVFERLLDIQVANGRIGAGDAFRMRNYHRDWPPYDRARYFLSTSSARQGSSWHTTFAEDLQQAIISTPGAVSDRSPLATMSVEYGRRLDNLPQRLRSQSPFDRAAFERLQPDLASYLSASANERTFDNLIDLAAAEGKITLNDRATVLAQTERYARASEFLSTFNNGNSSDDMSSFRGLLENAIRNNEETGRSALLKIDGLMRKEQGELAAWQAQNASLSRETFASSHQHHLANILSKGGNHATLDRLIDLAAAERKITLDDRAAVLAKTNRYERAFEFLSTFDAGNYSDDIPSFRGLLEKAMHNGDAADSALATIQSRVAQERRALEEWPARITWGGQLEGKALEQQQHALSKILASYSNSAVFERLLDIQVANGRIGAVDAYQIRYNYLFSQPYERANSFLRTSYSHHGSGWHTTFAEDLQQAIDYVRWGTNVPNIRL
ncbi:hypothetical protein C5615_37975 [Burkholderia cepacia]|uniref:Dermonecrotic toxin N-terminal domain-containing protein n=1 Tax=Burkholderia cepacia TaxID=292 RepID=A0A2S8HXF1_BURCE|nr:hypothetical protein C5615_37975 [Burkholderia cepacia]